MRDTIKKIIQDNRPDIDDIENTAFIDDGMLDSFDIVTLVSEFDKAFNISIDGADITPENFNTLDNMVNLVKKNGAK